MHALSNSTPLTVGKLLGRTIGLYRAHSGIFLRTAAIFYVPIAALSLFVENDALPTASTRCTGVLLPSGQRSGVVCVASRLISA